MNLLRVAESAATLFQKKTNIVLINAEDGNMIAEYTLNTAALPTSFDRPTILNIENSNWQVVKVEPVSKGSYFRAPKTLLYVTTPDTFHCGSNFLYPTVAQITEIETYKSNTPFGDFTLMLSPDDWLQLEFFSNANLNTVQADTAQIENILNTYDENNHLLGYSSTHVRDTRYGQPLTIQFNEFCDFIQPVRKGNISLRNNAFVYKGFTLESDSHIYYGIVEDGIIRKLAIQTFDCIDEELSDLLIKYNLIFVDWCNASVIMQ